MAENGNGNGNGANRSKRAMLIVVSALFGLLVTAAGGSLILGKTLALLEQRVESIERDIKEMQLDVRQLRDRAIGEGMETKASAYAGAILRER